MKRLRRAALFVGTLPREIVVGLSIIVLATAVTAVVSSAVHHPHAPSAAALPAGGGGAFVPASTSTTTVTTVPPTTTTTPTTVAAPPPTEAPRAVITTTTAPPPPPHSSAPAALTGVYVGSANPGGVAAFAAATGTHPRVVLDYEPAGAWSQIDGAGDSLGWEFNAWRGTGYQLVLGVPILDNSGTSTLAIGATGAYNPYFVVLAENLVNSGEGNAILRLGWEFTGSWDSWRVTDATDAANYAAYYRNIVTAMRSVPGQAFKYVWEGPDPQTGSYPGAYTADEAYPGDAYVDYIGNDYYDQSWSSVCGLAFNNTTTAAASLCTWEQGTLPSMNRMAAYAAAHGKPIVFPEWGLADRSDGHGMGDDPTFIALMDQWMATHNVAFDDYFNFDPPGQQDAITDGNFPNALAEYRATFG